MKIPLTKYGWPQVVIFPVSILILIIIVIALCVVKILHPGIALFLIIVLGSLLVFALAFFRDPHRNSPDDINLLLSPADGKITEIETTEDNDYFDGPVLKIGIFLSIFNVHINRAPCNVQIGEITYRKGKYKNALNPESSRVNESNELQMVRSDYPQAKLIVKQISGAIARRIVCQTSNGKKLKAGQRFGMIKFGSRTELYTAVEDMRSHEIKSINDSDNIVTNNEYKVKCLVKIGDKVKAGLTPLARYEKC